MMKRRIERIAVTIISIAMLLSSTGIIASLAANVGDTTVSSAVSTSTSEASSTTIAQEGGEITSSSVTVEGGSVDNDIPDGNGTASNPYKVNTADEFLAIQDIANITVNANKYFVLNSDIDLSTVKASDFKDNQIYKGSLVSVNKALSASSENVFVVLDGNGHKITGLNVSASTDSVSIFGYLNSKSVIKNIKVVSPVVQTTSVSAKYVSVLAAENDGAIKNVEIQSPVLTASAAKSTGIVAAVNKGTVSNVTVSSNISNTADAKTDKYTVKSAGAIGAIVGTNSGKISSVSALNIGAYVNTSEANSVYGGIVGSNSGTVSNSVSTGVVNGASSSDIAGGVAGKAAKGTKLNNVYSLVKISTLSGNGIIGAEGTSDMITDCYWSGRISGKKNMVTNYGNGINDMSVLGFKVVNKDSTVTVSSTELSGSWGMASISAPKSFSISGSGAKVVTSGKSAVITGVKADSVSTLKYTADIMLPSTVGNTNANITLTQQIPVSVLTAAKDSKGNGTAEAPFEVENSTQFNMISSTDGINAVLTKDITVDGAPFEFAGTLDGNGKSITKGSTIFTAVYGSVKNVNVVVNSDISTALFGKAVSANVENVSVSMQDGVKLTAKADNVGVLFNTVYGASVFENVNIKSKINVAENVSAVGAFAGNVAGEGTKIANSGANTVITKSADKTASMVAGFVGVISADNVSINNCYVSGKNSADKYSFIGGFKTQKATVKNVYMTKGTQVALDFNTYKFVDKSEFNTWKYEENDIMFFTGNGGKIIVPTPTVTAFSNAKTGDYTVKAESSNLVPSVQVKSGKLEMSVVKADGVVTVKNVPVTITNKVTGMSLTIYVSNGLEKNSDGVYVLTSAFDLAYLSENIEELSKEEFIIKNNIDMSVLDSFAPIGGTLASFSGKLNGNGHTISNLKIEAGAKAGLFGLLNGAEIKNIVFDKADISSNGSYVGVLAGMAENSAVSNVTVKNSKIDVSDIYSSALIGSINGGTVKNIKVENVELKSNANYVAVVSGYASGTATVSDIEVTAVTVDGGEFVAGLIGKADGNVSVSSVNVKDSKISGVNEVSGVMSSASAKVTLNNIKVSNTTVSTVSNESAYVAAGIASTFASNLSKVEIDGIKVVGGISAAVVGRSAENCKLNITDVDVKSSTVKSEGANTVAAAVLGVHASKGTVTLTNCTVDEKSTVKSAAICSAFIGDIIGADSVASITSSKTMAKISGSTTADAIASAALIGRIGIGALNNVSVTSVKALGTVSGSGAVAGGIGTVKDVNKFSAKTQLIRDSVIAVNVNPTDEATVLNAGVVIGAVENSKSFTNDSAKNAFTNVVISTYYNSVPAFGLSTGITADCCQNMDKLNGKSIKPSVEKLETTEETEVNLTNLPEIEGFTFDSEAGWASASSDRIEVISSAETSLVLKASHMANIAIVGYYVMDSDNSVRVPVHFDMISTVRTPLEGSGTKSSPYLVSDAYDLETLSQYDSQGKYFALSNDISFTAKDFKFGGAFYNIGNGIITLGNAEQAFAGNFTGLYNGKVHKISNMKMTGNTFGGLFGATDGAVISDLVIENADVSGLNYAGVLVGSAKDTIIKNVTIKSAKAATTEFGGITGSVVGYAVGTTVENVKVDSVTVSTVLNSTSATVESAGGIAGCFAGTISNVELDNAEIKSGSVAGGIVGTIKNTDSFVEISSVKSNANVTAKVAGGAVGTVSNPLQLSVKNAVVGGSVNASEISAGVIAVVADGYSVENAKSTLLENVVVSANVNKSEVSGVVIGKCDSATFPDTENKNTEVFKSVCYSSYQNNIPVFGNNEINAYQTLEYKATDLNEMKYNTADGAVDSIIFNSNKLVLSDDSITINGADGTYLKFTAGNAQFVLKEVKSNADNLISYNAENKVLSLNGVSTDNAYAEFVYENGMVLGMPISQDNSLKGDGTQKSPYVISSQDDFVLMMQTNSENVYYELANDISLEGIAAAEHFAGNLNGNGHALYDFTGETLFGSVSGTITNIGFVGFEISSNSKSVGTVAEILDGAVIDNCLVIANVVAGTDSQDAGVLAGRAVNATITNVVTSGKLVGKALMSAGGVVGLADSTVVRNITSTAYVSAKHNAGGIAGTVENSTISNVVFGNMVEASVVGNIAGTADKKSTIENAYYDINTAVTSNGFGSGDFKASPMATDYLTACVHDGFASRGGYIVPESLLKLTSSDKFVTALDFAAEEVVYLAGLNSGSALNYTDIKFSDSVNGNTVSVNKDSGLTITLTKDKDYADSVNSVIRYSNPASTNAVNVTYTITDTTGTLNGSLVSLMLKSKLGTNANAFDLFTKIGSDAKAINGVSVTGNGIYVNLNVSDEYKFIVNATDSTGKTLAVTDAANEGVFVNTEGADSINLAVSISDSDSSVWGLHSVWSSIAK